MSHAEIGHYGVFIDSGGILDPADHICGGVLQHTGDIDTITNARERRSHETRSSRNTWNDVAGATTVACDSDGPPGRTATCCRLGNLFCLALTTAICVDQTCQTNTRQ